MLPALVLASWWAQADPAPAAPPAVPSVAPAAPAPFTELDNRFALGAGYARRLGDEGGALGPRNGFGVGADYERRFFALPDRMELSAGAEFRYDRFQTAVSGTPIPGEVQPYWGDRILSQTSFAAVADGAWRWRRLRPFVQVGAGATIAYFSSPEMNLRPGNLTAVQPLARGTAGLDVAITGQVGITVRVAYTHVFTHPTLTTDVSSGAPATYSFLGDLFDAGAGVVLGF
ncbi:MAG TPA: hypothetical protein VHO67_23065 [Polyangia bacterium]|nr:hypothetical protein [Polyangia bacterium]